MIFAQDWLRLIGNVSVAVFAVGGIGLGFLTIFGRQLGRKDTR